ncbi:MAG: hypothetical protein ACOYMY_04970 [Prochlorococcaceae cyanobacterium]
MANFLAYTDQLSHLYVNLGCKSPAREDQISSSRVTVFRGGFERKAFGHTLLAGHMECFERATLDNPEFEYFTTVASNSLFFRFFDISEVLSRLESSTRRKPSVPLANLPDRWYWPKLRSQGTACETLAAKWKLELLVDGQIEGRVAHRSDWQLVKDVQASLVSNWSALEAPLEEILPPTVIHALGSGHTLNVCHNRFVEAKASYRGGFVKTADLVAPSLPDHICMIKWFERSILSPETLQVVTDHGRDLTSWLAAESRDSRTGIEQELLLGCNYQNLLSVRTKTNLVQNGSLKLPQSSTFQLISKRQVVDCDGSPSSRSSAFFFLEDTDVPLSFKLKTSAEGDLFVHCYFNGSPQQALPHPTAHLKQAYLYLPIPTSAALRLAVDASIHGVEPREILNNLCLFDGRSFGLRQPMTSSVVFHEFCFEVLFDTDACVTAHLGFPIFLGSSLRLRIFNVI